MFFSPCVFVFSRKDGRFLDKFNVAIFISFDLLSFKVTLSLRLPTTGFLPFFHSCQFFDFQQQPCFLLSPSLTGSSPRSFLCYMNSFLVSTLFASPVFSCIQHNKNCFQFSCISCVLCLHSHHSFSTDFPSLLLSLLSSPILPAWLRSSGCLLQGTFCDLSRLS